MTQADRRDCQLRALVCAIAAGQRMAVAEMLATTPGLARERAADGATRRVAHAHYLHEIGHYIYAGDTALHIAAAAYQKEIVVRLIGHGADVRAKNRRGAEPLHYAADGLPGSRAWDPRAQVATIACLVAAGADPNALDNSGVTPLHRAVRTRCAAAVKALLDGGADRHAKNKRGTTPLRLANLSTGRGGSGSAEAKAQQQEIRRLLGDAGDS